MKDAIIAVLILAAIGFGVWIFRGIQKDKEWEKRISDAPIKRDTITVWKLDSVHTQIVTNRTVKIYHDTVEIPPPSEGPVDTTIVWESDEDSVEVTIPMVLDHRSIILHDLTVKYPYRTITEQKIVLSPAEKDAWWKKPLIALSAGAAGVFAGQQKWGMAVLSAAPAVLTLSL